MKKYSLGMSAVFAFVCMYVFLKALTFPPGTNGALGPGFFPAVISAFGFFLTILNTISTLRLKEAPVEASYKKERQLSVRLTGIVLAITIAYFFCMLHIGFILSTAVYLFVIFTIFKVKSLRLKLILSLVTTVVIYFVFVKLLYVLLPGFNLF